MTFLDEFLHRCLEIGRDNDPALRPVRHEARGLERGVARDGDRDLRSLLASTLGSLFAASGTSVHGSDVCPQLAIGIGFLPVSNARTSSPSTITGAVASFRTNTVLAPPEA